MEKDRIQYKFMIPQELKSLLEDAAHDNRRSLSAEIVARLETSFTLAADAEKAYSKYKNQFNELDARISALEKDFENKGILPE